MNELREILERMAVGIERLAEDPVIQMETGPPVCPHCSKINPNVTVEESGGSGPMAEFVILCLCQHCNNTFYALPLQWQCVQTISELEQAVETRREVSGYGDNGKPNPSEN